MTLLFPFMIKTNRLVLRNYTPEDAGRLLEISRRNLRHWQEFESENILYDIPDLEAAGKVANILVEEWQAGRNYFIGLFDRTDGEFAGQIYVGSQPSASGEFEIGYVADVASQGKGLISEALTAVLEQLFNKTGAETLWIHCSDRNPRSAHVAERCGFKLVEHHPVSAHNPARGGELVYRLNREDWIKTHPG